VCVCVCVCVCVRVCVCVCVFVCVRERERERDRERERERERKFAGTGKPSWIKPLQLFTLCRGHFGHFSSDREHIVSLENTFYLVFLGLFFVFASHAAILVIARRYASSSSVLKG
jgi:hypothetical protein